MRAAKLVTSSVTSGATSGEPAAADPEVSAPGAALDIGGYGWIGARGAVGAVDHDGFRASWNLTFGNPEPPMFHLPKPWMYTASVPRTKSISAAPLLTLGGSLSVDGAAVDVGGWPCSIGHNWGAEHAERWIWLHADADTGPGGPTVWLDIVVGRIRLGPVTTPWIGNGTVSVAGQRYRLGGLRPGATRVVETARGATVILRGSGVRLEARSDIDFARSVGWTYADPAGHTREVVNSSVARTLFSVRRGGRPPLEVTAPVSAFELGAPRRAFDVPLQPFPD